MPIYRRVFINALENEKASMEKDRPDLSWSKLDGIRLRNQNLNRVIFFHTQLNEANLFCANLRNADLKNAELKKANLMNGDLNGADLSNADLSYSNLMEADLRNAIIWRTEFSYADLGLVSLSSGMQLIFSKFDGAMMTGVNLDHIICSDSSFTNVDFSNANLSNAMFYEGNLKNAVLKNAILNNTHFKNTDLSRIDFTDADIQYVTMIGANLKDAKITNEQLEKIILGEDIVMPNGELKHIPSEIKEFGDEIWIYYGGKLAFREKKIQDNQN